MQHRKVEGFFLLWFIITVAGPATTFAQECDSSGVCDKHERCSVWAEEGDCIRNAEYMKEICPISCRDGADAATGNATPTKGACEDMHPRCGLWASVGECEDNPTQMNHYCAKSCNACDADEDAADDESCQDQHENCPFWAEKGECTANSRYMENNCRKSCELCHKGAAKPPGLSAVDEDKARVLRQTEGFGVRQQAEGEHAATVMEIVQKTVDYMNSESTRKLSDKTLENCQNRHELCAFWASIGECENNQGTLCRQCKTVIACVQSPAETAWLSMGLSFCKTKLRCPWCEQHTCRQTGTMGGLIGLGCRGCGACVAISTPPDGFAALFAVASRSAPSCLSCHMIDVNTRCPPLDDQVPALHPGGLNKMFERIVRNAPGNRTLTDAEKKELADAKIPEYTVHVLSRPSETPAIEVSAVLDKSLPPWAITFDNFLTAEECDKIIAIGHQYGYKRSEDVGAEKFDGSRDSVKSAGRTSENAWCSFREGCRQLAVPSLIHDRIERVLNIPANNSEDFQILKYDVKQFYNTHHDYIPHQADRQCGPRILTFFMYLSDVEEGGGTNFPQLKLTVMPKKGRALLWPSVLDSDPMKKDQRFMHQALPVEKGLKYAMNGWIHMHDYVAAAAKGCN